jgi:hypothetical protein
VVRHEAPVPRAIELRTDDDTASEDRLDPGRPQVPAGPQCPLETFTAVIEEAPLAFGQMYP